MIKNQLSGNPSPVPPEAGGIFYSPIFERRKIRKTATEKSLKMGILAVKGHELGLPGETSYFDRLT